MINIRSIIKLTEGDGFTLKAGKKIQYKTGYQVAFEGIETEDARTAINAVKAYGGDCGVWFENGIYYIDKGRRVSTKKEAIQTGNQFNQISIYDWKRGACIYLK